MLDSKVVEVLNDVKMQLEKLSLSLYTGEDWANHAEAERIMGKIIGLIPTEVTNANSEKLS